MGIAPDNLLSQVRATAPFLFEGEPPAEGGPLRYVRRLRDADGRGLGGADYYALCLSAHWATAGTFVPTDVDNAIRWRLWQDASPALISAQTDQVLDARGWDYAPVTARRVAGPDGEPLSTHEGTWFSVAVGAYAACRQKLPARAAEVLAAMTEEARREHAVFSALADAGDGVQVLKASALIAHNFGDLDRVADQWELPAGDALRAALYDAAKPGSPLFGGLLGWAGALNRRFLSADNHRHYPLRAPKCLRRSGDLLIPVGPFFDGWGRAVARHPALSREDVAEVARALIDGWTRMHEPVGYARALSGILDAFPGGRQALGRLLPGADRRALESGPLKAALDAPQERFEAQWANRVRQVPRPKPVDALSRDNGASRAGRARASAVLAAGFLWFAARAGSAGIVAGFDRGPNPDASDLLNLAAASAAPGAPPAASPVAGSSLPLGALAQPDGGGPAIELTTLDPRSAAALFAEIAGDRDIPFDYPEGCEAKAQKIALLLDRKGIVSGKAFVQGQLYYQWHWGEDPSYWLFHVAPVILVDDGSGAKPFVIDPFLAKEILPYDKWLGLLKKDENTTIAQRYFTRRFVYGPDQRASNPDRYDPALLRDMETVLAQIRVKIAAEGTQRLPD